MDLANRLNFATAVAVGMAQSVFVAPQYNEGIDFKLLPPISHKRRNKPPRLIDTAKKYRRRKMAKASRRVNRK